MFFFCKILNTTSFFGIHVRAWPHGDTFKSIVSIWPQIPLKNLITYTTSFFTNVTNKKVHCFQLPMYIIGDIFNLHVNKFL
jgi:hypothetical protein